METSSNNNPTLKIIFVVLLLALLGELAYVLTVNKKNNVKFLVPTPTIPSFTKKPSTTSIPEYQGKIIELDVIKVTPIPGDDNIEFSFALKIDNGKAEKPQIFSFKKSGLEIMEVMSLTGKTIRYKDLKVGQSIIIKQKYDQKVGSYYSLRIFAYD